VPSVFTATIEADGTVRSFWQLTGEMQGRFRSMRSGKS
jgi:hypothetical protein